MNKEELEREVKNAKTFFRLTMGGNFEDFDTLEQLTEYMIKNWKNNYYITIRRLSEISEKDDTKENET